MSTQNYLNLSSFVHFALAIMKFHKIQKITEIKTMKKIHAEHVFIHSIIWFYYLHYYISMLECVCVCQWGVYTQNDSVHRISALIHFFIRFGLLLWLLRERKEEGDEVKRPIKGAEIIVRDYYEIDNNAISRKMIDLLRKIHR